MFELCSMHCLLHGIIRPEYSLPGVIHKVCAAHPRMFCACTFNDMDCFCSKHRHSYSLVWIHGRACREGLSRAAGGTIDAASGTRVSSIPLAILSTYSLITQRWPCLFRFDGWIMISTSSTEACWISTLQPRLPFLWLALVLPQFLSWVVHYHLRLRSA